MTKDLAVFACLQHRFLFVKQGPKCTWLCMHHPLCVTFTYAFQHPLEYTQPSPPAGGVLLWADVYNSIPGTSRDDAVLGRWERKIMEEYATLSPEERATIWAHISEHDFPEDLPTCEALLKGAGFAAPECTFTDDFYCAVWVGKKAEA